MWQLLHSVEVIHGDTGTFPSPTCSLPAGGMSLSSPEVFQNQTKT